MRYERAFRSSARPFGRLILYAFLPLWALCLILSAFLTPKNFLSDFAVVTAALVGVYLAALGFGWCMASIWKVTISPEGIRCSNYWGRIAFVSWGSIVDVRPASASGIPYLAFTSTERRSEGWLPLTLVDIDAFVDLVRDYAGEKNPVVAWFTDAMEETKEG